MKESGSHLCDLQPTVKQIIYCRVVNTDVFSGGYVFKTLPGRGLSLLRFYVVFLGILN
jgi:hypothetical protein